MSFIFSLFLILTGILISALETAIMTLEGEEKLKRILFSRIHLFKRNPDRFKFVSSCFKTFLFISAFVLLGVWSEGKMTLLFIVFVVAMFSIYLLQLAQNFSEKNPDLVVKRLEILIHFIFYLFKLSFLLPKKLIMFSGRSVDIVKREFEFLIHGIETDENPDENLLLKNVFEFNDKTVREIMVPRTKVVALDINAPREKVIKIVLNEGYSRLPVYRDTIDNIIGVIYAKDLINYIEEPNLFVLYDLLRPAYFVPETKKISELLKELQKNKIHIAIVVDEFGGFQGIVTLEDILEEIVGEIHDEYDQVEKSYEVLNDGSIVVDAGMLVSDFNRKFGEDIPEGTDYESIGGFVSKLAGRIPNEGEKIKFRNIVFEVLKKSKRKIIELKITRADKWAFLRKS
ncbi:MAG: hemolysin family protein [Candidatus Kryptonium sp.]|nr:hemolysin family protein [Candidatus Kryptonium sp.]MDW8108718.1 hemolysin family protein [Candidatus Kryptonium sp.]